MNADVDPEPFFLVIPAWSHQAQTPGSDLISAQREV